VAQTIGKGLLLAAPKLMRLLTIVGTAAMFLVGGGILVHGTPPLQHAIDGFTQPLGGLTALVLATLADGAVGIAAGALVLALLTLGRKLTGRRAAPT
jgi:predicted DNA repair protein MutK